MSEVVLRAAGHDRADAEAAGGVLGASFVDDPVWSWVFPNATTRPHKLRRFFTEDAWRMHLRHGLSTLALDGGRPVGAALWDPPGRWKVSVADEARLAPTMLGILGTRTIATLRLLGRVQARHYVAPHYYLFALGVDPSAQGRGIGVQLVAPVLKRCDEEGVPAYLESSNPRNLTFYARLGFHRIGDVACPDGPTLTLMLRAPKPKSADSIAAVR